MTETGAPIWETYCDSPACGKLAIEELVTGVQEARKRDDLAELRRLIAKYPEESWPIQRSFIESTVSALLGVIYRYEEEIDPDHETITAIGHGKALQALLRNSSHES